MEQKNVPKSPEPTFQSPQPHHERNGVEDEEDLSCPPDLEEVSESVQAQPEIETLDSASLPVNFNPNIVRELTLAIKESMQNYQDMGDNYEPSADELIDVLKNLENLAAVNPALYRAIVDQIKVSNLSESGRDTPNYDKIPDVNGSTQVAYEQSKQTSSAYYQESSQMNGSTQQYEQEMYEQQMYKQQQKEAEMYQQQLEQQQMEMEMQQQIQQQMYEEQKMMSKTTTMVQETSMTQQTRHQQETLTQQQVQEQMKKLNM